MQTNFSAKFELILSDWILKLLSNSVEPTRIS
jgi:hypothetical protein